MGKQKRSENTYTKINTVFFRDENNIIMPFDELVTPELAWLRNCKFDATEKIDGTNIRIEVTKVITEGDASIDPMITWDVKYKGKTDNANVPKMLMEHLQTTYPKEKVLAALHLEEIWLDKVNDTDMAVFFKATEDIDKIPNRFTLYGEGYGVKIQSCGGRYLKDSNSFIGFDVKVDDMYLLRPAMLETFERLNCPTVPYIGQFTIDEAIEFVKKGFTSTIAEDEFFLAEGLVLKSPFEIKSRRGDRICFKVKTCDWDKYFAKYGTYDKVEQKRNTKANVE